MLFKVKLKPWEKVGPSPSGLVPPEVPELHLPQVQEGNFRFSEHAPQPAVPVPPWQPEAGRPEPVVEAVLSN